MHLRSYEQLGVVFQRACGQFADGAICPTTDVSSELPQFGVL